MSISFDNSEEGKNTIYIKIPNFQSDPGSHVLTCPWSLQRRQEAKPICENRWRRELNFFKIKKI